jgi:DNA-binding response OmpR family regulator
MAAAREHLNRSSFTVVVLDVNLPDGDGIDLLEELSHNPRLCRTPVLLLSNESAVRTRIRGMARGAVEYIGKPYDRDYLVERVGELSHHADGVGRVQRWLGDQRVLVIDGGTLSCDALSHHLRCDGHVVVIARSAEEALEFLAVDAFGCVVLNLDTLGPAGADVCRRIKEEPGGAKTPVLVLTERDDAEVRRAASAAGAEEVVFATATFGLLRIRLRSLLRKKRREAEPKVASDEHPGGSAHPPAPDASLFSQVVAASGLLPSIAPSTIERACRRAGVMDAKTLSPVALSRALPLIRESLGELLSPAEVARRMKSITTLAKPQR